jgi:hypothetical protein
VPARRRHSRARSAGVALLLALAARPATAQFTITANSGRAYADAQGSASWFPAQRDERFYGPNGGAAVGELDLRGFGHLRGVQLDYGLNAVRVDASPGDLTSFSFGAGTSIDVTVENAGPVTADPLIFEYTISAGQLRLRSFAGSFDGFIASVSVSIFTIAPGHSGFLWAWTQSLRGQGGAVSTSTDFLLDPLGFGTPSMSAITFAADEAFVDIASFHRSADLGRLARGSSAFITYDMDAAVAGPGFGGGGVAALGDPFDVTGRPGSTLLIQGAPIGAVVSAVPEPATSLLVGLGLAALGASGAGRRRRR